MTKYPTADEIDEAIGNVNYQDLLDQMPDSYKTDEVVATLNPLGNGTFNLAAVHNLADTAEVLQLPLSYSLGALVVTRPQTDKELMKSVRSYMGNKLYNIREMAERGEKDE